MKRLEYRGYGSCGVALHVDGRLQRSRSTARVAELETQMASAGLEGFTRYIARHLVENLFQRMKIFRRGATRFEKLDKRFMAFVHIVGIMKWIH